MIPEVTVVVPSGSMRGIRGSTTVPINCRIRNVNPGQEVLGATLPDDCAVSRLSPRALAGRRPRWACTCERTTTREPHHYAPAYPYERELAGPARGDAHRYAVTDQLPPQYLAGVCGASV